VLAECWETFPDLYFLFKGHWIEVLRDDYVIDWSERGDRSLCHLLILPSTEEHFIFGLPLFQGYYVHHDMTNSQIGFVPSRTSMKDYVTAATVFPYELLTSP